MTNEPIQPGTLCINCSYDLVGLQESALCPECAKECAISVSHYRELSQKHSPLSTIYQGLRKTLIGYAVFALLLFATLALGSLAIYIEDAPFLFSILLLGALCYGVYSYIAGIIQIATPFPNPSNPSNTSTFTKIVWTSLIGSILLMVFAVPVLGIIGGTVPHAIAYAILPGALLLLIFGTAGFANNVTASIGSGSYRTPLLVVQAAACISMIAVLVSAGSFVYADQMISSRPLGLTGGNWQDIFILAVLALFVAHFLVTLIFWLSLRKHMRSLTTPTAPTTTP
ncbi:MAG: hypothetical protein Phyf2KO_26910 [Phycisphaerales bacterium]